MNFHGRVQGKKALITGAAQGLGAATARMLARHGAQVLLTDLNVGAAQDVAHSINTEIGNEVAWGFRHDATSQDDWKAALDHARGASERELVIVEITD